LREIDEPRESESRFRTPWTADRLGLPYGGAFFQIQRAADVAG
jgi:hypothetical protein